MRKLIHYDFNVPGGYKYVQTETGMKFDGNTPWKAQILQIVRHRKANGLPRATYDEVFEDLEAYTCNRVPALCSNSVAQNTAAPAAPRKVGGCGGCGGRKR